MVKRGLVVLFLVMFCVSLVAATTTKVDIKTLPDHEVQASVSKAGLGTFVSINHSKKQSDEYGDAFFTFSFNDAKYNLFIFIKKNNSRVMDEKLFDLDSGEDVYLELVPDGFDIIETPELEEVILNETVLNETLNETLIDDNETGEDGESSLTGFATDVGGKVKDFFSKSFIYYILGVVVVGVFVFVARKKGYKIVRERN